MTTFFQYKNVYTNVFGIARSAVAFSLLISITLTDYSLNFSKDASSRNSTDFIINFFHLFGPENQLVSVILAAVILGIVITGYLPQITCLLHAWIAHSFFSGAVLVEGGDQLAQIITILLIPIGVTDKRLNHWGTTELFNYNRPYFLEYFAYSSLCMIQIQMAVLYFFASAEKIKVAEWRDGSAFYYWFNHVPFGANEGVNFTFSSVVNSQAMGPIISWSVIALEAILFAALFMDYGKRKVLLYFALIFHLLIIVVHGLASFFFAIAGGLVLYLWPPDIYVNINVPVLNHFAISKLKMSSLFKA
jgi:antimicrobial peptide system SdpB family protein